MTSATLTKEAVGSSETNPFELSEKVLLAIHRCDNCNAPAYVRAWKPPYENELLFCSHHGRTHMAALKKQGFTIDDQSKRLYDNTKPDGGSAAG